MNKIKVLNANQLKYGLIVLMVLNHIHYMFDFTGKIPVIFEYIGYFVAPCFLLLMVDGYNLTSNRKKYYFRLWMIAAPMGLIQWMGKNLGFAVRNDGFYLLNGIISNFLVLFVFFSGIDCIQQKRYLKGWTIVLAPFVWGIALVKISQYVPAAKMTLELIHWILFPNLFWITDGGTSFVLCGILAYLTRKNRTIQVVTSSISLFLFYSLLGGFFWQFVNGESFSFVFQFNWAYFWVGIGFLPMLFYNGKKGKGSTKFFYYFYPLHVYVLYAISGIVFGMVTGISQMETVVIPMIGVIIVFSGLFAFNNFLGTPPKKPCTKDGSSVTTG